METPACHSPIARAEDYQSSGSWYAETCERHLWRIKLSRDLALAHLQESELALDEELIGRSIGPATGNLAARIGDTVTKTHFLLLKVEFEYYLSRIIRHVWESFFGALVECRPKALSEKHQLGDFARAVAGDSGRHYVIRQLVPRHGLERLRRALKEATQVDLAPILSKHNPQDWCQISSAFQVRHLVEHANARVDAAFLHDVADKPPWKRSSWGSLRLDVGSKIDIRDNDFEHTCASMVAAVPAIWDALKDFSPSEKTS